MRVGVDAGGTFTDFVVLRDDGSLDSFKLRSNPQDPASVILEGLRRAGALTATKAEVVHGSTVATNALLERKGAHTALITTAGFEDVIEIGRQNRRHLYSLTPPPVRSLVPPELRYGIEERTYFDGTVALRPKPGAIRSVVRRLRLDRVESVAVCFLHSYKNAENEKAVAQALETFNGYICASHEIAPEFREYERTSTVVLNAYVGPLMDRYLEALEAGGRGRL
ncbi:MAG TPA: hydantoinase/oxoprolinase family protein, partial [Bryobacteraceae bacterium]|nr:hydantoinase/oxoprolinase family protein [Bryobacteraceae bacterium]